MSISLSRTVSRSIVLQLPSSAHTGPIRINDRRLGRAGADGGRVLAIPKRNLVITMGHVMVISIEYLHHPPNPAATSAD
jgi:hypothetical protein